MGIPTLALVVRTRGAFVLALIEMYHVTISQYGNANRYVTCIAGVQMPYRLSPIELGVCHDAAASFFAVRRALI
jgi:hypothetical protein